MRNSGLIYKITNRINGKVYIGQTIQKLKDRLNKHLSDARNGSQYYLYRAIRFYGSENFKIKIIERVRKNKLNEREIYWVKYYKSDDSNFGYNLTEGGFSFGHGNKNPAYKEVDTALLKEYLEKGINVNTISKRLEIHRKTILKRVQQFWGLDSILQARRQFMSEKKFSEFLSKRSPSYKEIDEEILKSYIMQGLNGNQIASKLKINPSTLHSKTNEYWGMTLLETRRYFIKPQLKSLIKQNQKDIQIAEKLKTSKNTVYRLVNEFWGLSIIQARKAFLKSDLELLISQHKTAEEIGKELNISSSTVQNWVKELWGLTLSQTWKILIKSQLASLIEKHLKGKQIADELNIDESMVFRFTKEFWNKTLTQAWRMFVKPNLKNYILQGLSSTEISQELNINQSTVYSLTKEFWNVKFSEAYDFFNQ